MSEQDPAAVWTTRQVLERCAHLGFAGAGVCGAAPSERSAAFRAWIARGEHGTMEYLAEEVETRLDPGKLVAGARSVICVADRYSTGARDARHPGLGRIARYARGEDYHVTVRARLEALADELQLRHTGHAFRVCVDTAPLLEREFAARAGLGRVGKHTLLIGPPGVGSWLVLGAIVTTLELEPSVRAADDAPDPCGSCSRCIDACPTQAIRPWSVDARRCVSYVTIEHRGPVPSDVGRGVRDWVFGCDICQEVCPHNQPTIASRAAGIHPAYAEHTAAFDLLQVLGWTQSHWEQARLHGALRRADRAMWVRNAALAAGAALSGEDGGEPLPALARQLHDALQELARNPGEEASVRGAAEQSLMLAARPEGADRSPEA